MRILSLIEKRIKATPLVISVVYVIVSALWIILSDYLLISYVKEPHLLTFYQTIKGWFFILVTAMLLYILIRSSFRRIEQLASQLVKSETHYRMLMEQASDGIVITDAKGNIKEINTHAGQILGYIQPELINRNISDLIDKKDLESTPLRFNELCTGTTIFSERYLIQKNGNTIRVEISSKMLEDKDIMIIFRDITKRKMIEEKIRESERQYKLLFYDNPHPMWVYDTDTLAILTVNNAAVVKYGYSQEEFLRMTVKDLYPYEDEPRLLDDLSKRTDEYQQHGTWNHKLKDWSLIFVDVASHSITFAGKKARLVIAYDVSEMQSAFDALKVSEMRYKSLFEKTPIAVWEEDLSIIKTHINLLKRTGVTDFREYLEKYPEEIPGSISTVKIIDINDAALDLYEAANKEELIAGMKSIFEISSYSAQKEIIIAIAEGKIRFEIEMENKTLKGKTISVVVRWIVEEGFEDTYSKVLLTITDVTKRKETEEALKSINSNLISMVNASALPMYVVDFDGTVKYGWNKAAETIFGWQEQEVLSRFSPIIPEENKDQFLTMLKEVKTGKVFTGIDVKRIKKDGTCLSMKLSAAPMHDSEGKITGSINILLQENNYK